MTHARVGLYFEDLVVGQEFSSTFHTVEAVHIREFALLMGETNPLHTDEDYASTSHFRHLTASGSFGLTLTISLLEELELFHGTAIAALGINDWRYEKPITPGLRCQSRMTIQGLTPKPHSNSGLVLRHFDLVDHENTRLQSGDAPLLVMTRRRTQLSS